MPSKIRLNRIGDRIRNELAAMLVTEVSDPRLSGIFVTDVKVDRELAYADIFVSAVEGHERAQEVLNGLHSAASFLRRALADRVDLRVFPRLRFHWDPTPERADQIERVLQTLRNETQNSASPAVEDDEQDDENEMVDTAADEATLEDEEAIVDEEALADASALDDFSVAEDLEAADDLPGNDE